MRCGRLALNEQDAASGPYGLGPLAMELAPTGLRRLDPMALATERIEPPTAANGTVTW